MRHNELRLQRLLHKMWCILRQISKRLRRKKFSPLCIGIDSTCVFSRTADLYGESLLTPLEIGEEKLL